MKLLYALMTFLLSFQFYLHSDEESVAERNVNANQIYPLVAITFHYTPARLKYLREVLDGLSTFPKIDVIICTNTDKFKELDKIKKRVSFKRANMTISVRSFTNLSHPYELTWSHKPIISNEFLPDKKEYTHFIYLEDDIKLDINNFLYFLEYREILRPYGLLPAFLRVEYQKSTGRLVNTDNVYRHSMAKCKQVPIDDDLVFVNMENPYNACFILDKELAAEYVQSRSFDIRKSAFWWWEVRERAAMGLCFENIPSGYSSRYVIPVSYSIKMTPMFAWVYHLPNNYANSVDNPFDKISMDSLFIFP